DPDHWVVTWAAAEQQPAAAGAGRRGAPASPAAATPAQTGRAATPPQVATAPPAAISAAPAAVPAVSATTVGYDNQTVRVFLRTSLGGRKLRVQLSNAFGVSPLDIGAAH